MVVGLFGVHVHRHAVGGGSMAAMVGEGIAVVNMGVLPDVELPILAGAQPTCVILF